MEEHYPTNRLVYFRKRMKLSQKQVAQILGLESAAILSLYEKGTAQPSLERALALEIVYRVPIAFLFPGIYERMREGLHAKEDHLAHQRLSKTIQTKNKH